MRILLWTWPWLKPMVIGTWRERALPISTKRQPGHGVGFGYAPVLVTVFAALGPNSWTVGRQLANTTCS